MLVIREAVIQRANNATQPIRWLHCRSDILGKVLDKALPPIDPARPHLKVF